MNALFFKVFGIGAPLSFGGELNCLFLPAVQRESRENFSSFAAARALIS